MDTPLTPFTATERSSTRVVLAILLSVTASLLFWPSQSAVARARRARTVSKSYATPAIGLVQFMGQDAGDTGETLCAEADAGCTKFKARPRERFVRVRVRDRSGMPVYTSVWPYPDGDGPRTPPKGYLFCGRWHGGMMEIPPGATVTVGVWEPIQVYLYLNPPFPSLELACDGALATSGVIDVTFRRGFGAG